jgi:hypothetical protein
MLTIDPHPLLDLRAFVTVFPRPLGEMPSPPDLLALLSLHASAPLHSDDAVRERVRALLRHGGFKPTGRSKPASEYLLKAVGEGRLSSINMAVDACNVVSLHSGLPVSVVDLDRARPPCPAHQDRNGDGAHAFGDLGERRPAGSGATGPDVVPRLAGTTRGENGNSYVVLGRWIARTRQRASSHGACRGRPANHVNKGLASGMRPRDLSVISTF